MDFRIKIDLSNQSIIENTPTKDKKKKKIDKSKKNPESEIKTPEVNKKKRPIQKIEKKESISSQVKELLIEKPKLNSSSILSLNLPYNENTKNDQSQKLSLINKKKPRHWEKRWVLINNVFEFTKEIWLKKWVLVDGEDDIIDNNVSIIYFIDYSRIIFYNTIQQTSNLLKKLYRKNINAHLMNVGKYLWILVL
jgi:hypothetical protein